MYINVSVVTRILLLMDKSLTIQKGMSKQTKTKKTQNRNQKKERFIQLFIPHCTAMCQSKGGGVISLKQGKSPVVGKIWNRAQQWSLEYF